LTVKRTLLPLAFAVLLGLPGYAAAATFDAPAADGSRTPIVPLGGGADYAIVVPGSTAPNFAYTTLAGGTARLRDLREQGHVLLVFGGSEEDLRDLAQESSDLTRLGVVPVAVLDWSVGACRDVVKRLGLTYPVVPDAQRAIGAQYNALDPDTRHDARAWFVVDHSGRVRGLDRFEFPVASWSNVAATALGLPMDDAPVPASHTEP